MQYQEQVVLPHVSVGSSALPVSSKRTDYPLAWSETTRAWALGEEAMALILIADDDETVSIAERFDTRLRKSHERLTELTAKLSGAGSEAAMQLMREAAGIAHVLAGTSGMFGRGALGKVAQLVEVELKGIACGQSTDRSAKAGDTIGRLIAALDASPSNARAPAPA